MCAGLGPAPCPGRTGTCACTRPPQPWCCAVASVALAKRQPGAELPRSPSSGPGTEWLPLAAVHSPWGASKGSSSQGSSTVPGGPPSSARHLDACLCPLTPEQQELGTCPWQPKPEAQTTEMTGSPKSWESWWTGAGRGWGEGQEGLQPGVGHGPGRRAARGGGRSAAAPGSLCSAGESRLCPTCRASGQGRTAGVPGTS